MVTGLPARRDPCDDYFRQATLVEFRGSNLSDAGSIPAISTKQIDRHGLLGKSCRSICFNHPLDNYIRRGYSCQELNEIGQQLNCCPNHMSGDGGN